VASGRSERVTYDQKVREVSHTAVAGACRACGGPLPDGANFCPQCGAALNAAQSASEFSRSDFESCVIRPWKGYRKFEFCAVSLADGSEVGRSKGFRQRGSSPTDDEPSRAAHTKLAEQLAEAGWHAQARGVDAPWYEMHFVRSIPGDQGRKPSDRL
jgi:zinc-ribbon domain